MTGPGHYIALGKTVKDTDNSYRILGPQEKKKKKKKCGQIDFSIHWCDFINEWEKYKKKRKLL